METSNPTPIKPCNSPPVKSVKRKSTTAADGQSEPKRKRSTSSTTECKRSTTTERKRSTTESRRHMKECIETVTKIPCALSNSTLWDCVYMSDVYKTIRQQSSDRAQQQWSDRATQWNTNVQLLIVKLHDKCKTSTYTRDIVSDAHNVLQLILDCGRSAKSNREWVEPGSLLYTTYHMWFHLWSKKLERIYASVYKKLIHAPTSWIRLWKSSQNGKRYALFITLDEIFTSKSTSWCKVFDEHYGSITFLEDMFRRRIESEETSTSFKNQSESKQTLHKQSLHKQSLHKQSLHSPSLFFTTTWNRLFHRANQSIKQFLFWSYHYVIPDALWRQYFDQAFYDVDEEEGVNILHVAAVPTHVIVEPVDSGRRLEMANLMIPDIYQARRWIDTSTAVSLNESMVLRIIDLFVQEAGTQADQEAGGAEEARAKDWETELTQLVTKRITHRIGNLHYNKPWDPIELQAWYQHWFRHRQLPMFNRYEWAETQHPTYSLLEIFIRDCLRYDKSTKSNQLDGCYFPTQSPIQSKLIRWLYVIFHVERRRINKNHESVLVLTRWMKNHTRGVRRHVNLWKQIFGINSPECALLRDHWICEMVSSTLQNVQVHVEMYIPRVLASIVAEYV
jgi:hypothetical protein